MSDHWTDRLSDYLDGELGATEREALEAHLSDCPGCTATLEQLRGVVARARALDDQAPAADLWAGIGQRIAASPGHEAEVSDLGAARARQRGAAWGRRLSFSLPQLAAASIALMVLSGGAGWLLTRAPATGPDTALPGGAVDAALVSALPASSFGIFGYDAAVAELEGVVDERREQLDTATVRIIEENLLTIDRAIVQAQRALAQDPASVYLNEHLAATMRQKLEFLQRAAEMAGSVS